MPKFAYKGVDQEGKEAFGIIEADSEADALTEIGRKGLFVEEVHPANIGDEWRVKRQDAKRQREHRQELQKQAKRKRHIRQRLVVRCKDGSAIYGMCYALNPKEDLFHLDVVDETGTTIGETRKIRFADLKAVFYVKSFDGKFDKSAKYREWTAEGTELYVEFEDGEVIHGFTYHPYDSTEPRFHLIPVDQSTNNMSILVEASAVKAVYTAEEYHQKRKKAREESKSKEVSDDLSKEETMGDFYFGSRNYNAALEQYRLAAKQFPQSHRIRGKVLACEYNIGIQFIKSHDYAEALERMEGILRVDPRNGHARKKALQLRRILEREQRQKDRGQAAVDKP